MANIGLIILGFILWVLLLLCQIIYWNFRHEEYDDDDDEQNYDVRPAGELSAHHLNECYRQLATIPIIIYKQPSSYSSYSISANPVVNEDDNDSRVKSNCDQCSCDAAAAAVTEDNDTRGMKCKCHIAGNVDDDDAEEKVCVICLDEIEEGEAVRILPKCKHVFHQKCIDPWFIKKSSFCPLCRTRVIKRRVEPQSFHRININL